MVYTRDELRLISSAMATLICDGSGGLWYFPPPPARQSRAAPDPEKLREIRIKSDRVRQEGFERSAALVRSLRDEGASRSDVFERQAWDALEVRLKAQSNRCMRCWHDRATHCICAAVRTVKLDLPVRVLVWMHHKEYYRASDDAKLLLMMLPPEHARLFIFGKPGDTDALRTELNVDPVHTLVLWPGDGAATVEQFVRSLPPESAWQRASHAGTLEDTVRRPVLRVVVLDAVYRHARTMFRHLSKLQGDAPVRHVALHPKTLSVYSRAQHGYAQASAASIAQSADPEALRICTVEAYALLLRELGETEGRTREFVQAVVANNEALKKGGAAG